MINAEPNDGHLNPVTMLDGCMGLAIQSTLEKGTGSTTLEFKISFVRPITPQTGQIKVEGSNPFARSNFLSPS
jgi:hypothetical protein